MEKDTVLKIAEMAAKKAQDRFPRFYQNHPLGQSTIEQVAGQWYEEAAQFIGHLEREDITREQGHRELVETIERLEAGLKSQDACHDTINIWPDVPSTYPDFDMYCGKMVLQALLPLVADPSSAVARIMDTTTAMTRLAKFPAMPPAFAAAWKAGEWAKAYFELEKKLERLDRKLLEEIELIAENEPGLSKRYETTHAKNPERLWSKVFGAMPIQEWVELEDKEAWRRINQFLEDYRQRFPLEDDLQQPTTPAKPTIEPPANPELVALFVDSEKDPEKLINEMARVLRIERGATRDKSRILAMYEVLKENGYLVPGNPPQDCKVIAGFLGITLGKNWYSSTTSLPPVKFEQYKNTLKSMFPGNSR